MTLKELFNIQKESDELVQRMNQFDPHTEAESALKRAMGAGLEYALLLSARCKVVGEPSSMEGLGTRLVALLTIPFDDDYEHPSGE